ncbi:MAG TPA: hypothetical protein PJ991_00285 [Kiritimatiellia bacterium]|nr:hypothetical protein [Kiritimatiellia bacterium]
MAKKGESSVSLDSFLDILTCLQGVLMLIIITTGIDAAQTKIVVATPIELAGNEKPIFIECRNNQLFLVPHLEARQAVQMKQLEILRNRRAAGQDSVAMLEAVGQSDIDIGDYIIDFTRFLSGQIALMPKTEARGYVINSAEGETANTWFGGILHRMDPENERINFLVRDDSFEIFKLARIVAWTKNVKVTYSLISRNEPLIF